MVAWVGLIIPPAIDQSEPSGPAPAGQDRSSGGALHLDLRGLARSLAGWPTADGMISRTGMRRCAVFTFRQVRRTSAWPLAIPRAGQYCPPGHRG